MADGKLVEVWTSESLFPAVVVAVRVEDVAGGGNEVNSSCSHL